MDKLQFLGLIFAVLLSKSCNVLLCNYLSSFSILKIAVVCHIRLSKITRRWGPICTTAPNFMKIGQKVADIWRFNGFQNGGRPPSCILKIKIFKRSEWWRNLFCIVVPNFVKIGQTIITIIIIIIKGFNIAQVRKCYKCAMSAEMAVWLRNCLCLYSYLHNKLSRQLNRNVFRCLLKAYSMTSLEHSATGKLFQATGPLTVKLLSP